jgi:hypothetical protein
LRDKRPIERKKQSWTKPNKGTIKLNVDVAYDDDQGHGRLGVVARDYTGKFMVASCKKIPLFVVDSFMAEAHALREGLSLA